MNKEEKDVILSKKEWLEILKKSNKNETTLECLKLIGYCPEIGNLVFKDMKRKQYIFISQGFFVKMNNMINSIKKNEK